MVGLYKMKLYFKNTVKCLKGTIWYEFKLIYNSDINLMIKKRTPLALIWLNHVIIILNYKHKILQYILPYFPHQSYRLWWKDLSFSSHLVFPWPTWSYPFPWTTWSHPALLINMLCYSIMIQPYCKELLFQLGSFPL